MVIARLHSLAACVFACVRAYAGLRHKARLQEMLAISQYIYNTEFGQVT